MNSAYPIVSVGEVLEFGQKSRGTLLLQSGWSLPEPGLTWTNARYSTMGFRSKARSFSAIEIQLVPFIEAEYVNYQDLHLFLNGLFLGAFRIATPSTVNVPVPHWARNSYDCNLSFACLTAVAPSSGQDKRLLAIAAKSLRLIG